MILHQAVTLGGVGIDPIREACVRTGESLHFLLPEESVLDWFACAMRRVLGLLVVFIMMSVGINTARSVAILHGILRDMAGTGGAHPAPAYGSSEWEFIYRLKVRWSGLTPARA